jgi:thiol-disulfide isomerase/thioredoxin
MSTKALIGVLLAGTVGILIFLFVHLSGGPSRISIGTNKASACDRKAHGDECLPDIKYVDTGGKAYTLDALAGKVVLVNFWATWCGPCKKEIPDLSKLYDKYKDKGVMILGVMADNPGDSELLNFQSDHEMSFPVVRGNSDLMVAFSYPQALPTTFVYDRGGRMVGRPHVGAISPAEISATIDELVATSSP